VSLSVEPNYKRIVRLLEEKIRSGEYPPGHQLPPERELCAVYGVSRITARQAMAELANARLIVRRQGQGTFVAEVKVDSSLLGYFSLSEALKAQGFLIATKVVSQETARADAETAEKLGLAPGAEIFRLVRVRLLDGEPLALETSCLPTARFPGIAAYDFAGRSLYAVLRHEYRATLARARETLEPMLPDRDQVALLRLAKPLPALLLMRTTFDDGDTPVEAADAIIRGDRCRMLFELWADQRSGFVPVTAREG
jgi:GntR family transcriptional regulator